MILCIKLQSKIILKYWFWFLITALQEKLEKEAAGIKAKLTEADERTAKVCNDYFKI